MMNSHMAWIGVALLVAATGCSSDDDGGGGGTAGTGAGGSAGAGVCEDAQNPMFGSCIETFLMGCWAPDLSGTCSSANGATSWSDGSKYDPQGTMPGMYGPADTEPCVGIQVNGGNITATKGSDTLTYVADQATETATITCPDGSTFTATFEQVTAFNTCVGLNCPE
ncbi:MAG: hypothetical protein KC492_33600 [Myxococcales bacterium]|nr:hypothetical protein [Myxococcales bacterium]